MPTTTRQPRLWFARFSEFASTRLLVSLLALHARRVDAPEHQRQLLRRHLDAPSLLKRPENLDPSRKEPQRLREALRLNEPLATAYYLKEELNEIWEQDDQEAADAVLVDWIAYAESTGIRMLHDFAKTLRFHACGILAYYDYPISTAPLEGTNNKIKTMKRQAYGFRDQEFLKLKILGIHQTKYALVG